MTYNNIANHLRDTMEKMRYNHQTEREKMARVIRRLVVSAILVAERHPKAVTIHGQNARVEGGLWLAEFDRQNNENTQTSNQNILMPDKTNHHIYSVPVIGTIVRKWDRFVHNLAIGAFSRMTRNNPGLAYLMELHARHYCDSLHLPESLKQSTEDFFYAMNDHYDRQQKQTDVH